MLVLVLVLVLVLETTLRSKGTPTVPPQLDHEKLDVYQIELQFVAWSTELTIELVASANAKARRIAEACDHLDRAGLSSLFNTAEGNGKRQMKTRAKFFDDARGSATECAACLDALVAKGACDERRIEHGKSLLIRVVSMSSKLVDRFSPSSQIREDGVSYRIEDEDEDEDARNPVVADGRTSVSQGTKPRTSPTVTDGSEMMSQSHQGGLP